MLVAVSGNRDRIRFAVRRDGQLDVVSVTFIRGLVVRDEFVGDVVDAAVGPQILVDLIDRLQGLCRLQIRKHFRQAAGKQIFFVKVLRKVMFA